jgi:16S rRNA (cytosine967-C5)-methyltransferase
MPDSRTLALHVLKDVMKKGMKPKDSFNHATESGEMSRRDKAFMMELIYGVIRHRDTLDWILRKFFLKPRMPGIDTLNNLRTGAYQIFYMRVPEWASVNETVTLEKRHKGLVNAVLRNVLRGRKEVESELNDIKGRIPGNPESLVSDISVLTSHPEWIIKRWTKRLGPTEAFELAEANNRPPTLTLRVNTLRATREEVLRKLNRTGMEAEPTPLSPDGILLKGHCAYSELKPFWGLVLAQDEAAQLMSYMLDPRPGEKVLDACAAPGGKTTHMAQLMKDKGEIIAMDYDKDRLEILKENVSALGVDSVSILQADITEYDKPGAFDRVMLDAPCSALGTIRRNPDVKYRHQRKDLKKFKENQKRMLVYASRLLRPGGTLLYSTCSTEPEEGEEVVTEFLKTSEEFYIIKDLHAVVEPLSSGGFIRTWPHRHGMDGFFGAAIKKLN